MFAGSTLFVDVCVQRDFWPGGSWPLVDAATARHVASLFAVAARLGIRQGGVCCAHGPAETPAGAPRHCIVGSDGAGRAPDCTPCGTVVVAAPNDDDRALTLDRASVYYLGSGCVLPIDTEPTGRAIVEHLTAGIRDAVVFGVGIETALDHVVDALLRRRLRTHVVLDAAVAADATRAQQVIDGWKRRGVDGLTTATVHRLLGITTD